MKKIYLVLLILAGTASSCKKEWLQIAPKDAYTSANFYANDTQFKAAVAAMYAPLRDLLANDYLTSESHSDNTIYQTTSNRGTAYVERENISDFKNTSTNAYAAATWQHCYTSISRANIVIDRLAGASFLTDAARNSYEGQAKFLRAFNYFKLVRLFGGVPLFVHEVKSAQESFLARSAEAEVYAQIVADAQDAVSKLSAPARFPQTGEATKGSATVLLADVFVTLKRYAEAEVLLNTLPAMGYALNANYADAFNPLRKNGVESMFDLQYVEGSTTGTTPNFVVINQFLPRSNTAANGATTPVTGVAYDNNANGGFAIPSQDLIDSFEPGDKRLDASIGIIEGVATAANLLTYQTVKPVLNYTPAAGKVGYPYIKKFIFPGATVLGGTSVNFPFYRYADALLLLAEALNEQGKSPATPLNAVRTRAGLTATTATGQAALRTAILRERRSELAFENKRWHDLQRSGTAITVINAFGTKLRSQPAYGYLAADAYVIDAHHLLFPIPQTDVGINPAIIQNPGYF